MNRYTIICNRPRSIEKLYNLSQALKKIYYKKKNLLEGDFFYFEITKHCFAQYKMATLYLHFCQRTNSHKNFLYLISGIVIQEQIAFFALVISYACVVR